MSLIVGRDSPHTSCRSPAQPAQQRNPGGEEHAQHQQSRWEHQRCDEFHESPPEIPGRGAWAEKPVWTVAGGG